MSAKIEIGKRPSKVFVYFPKGHRTGGPEALHQLVHELRVLGVDAWLVASPATRGAAAVREYEIYDAPEAADVEDVPGNAVVIPEANLKLAWRFRSAHVYMWWLSIDFSTLFYAERRLRTLRVGNFGSLVKYVYFFLAQSAYPFRRTRLRRRANVSHLAQSAYAKSFLRARLGVESDMLSDITRGEVVADRPDLARGRTVAYNPAKGGPLVAQVVRRINPDWTLVPLRGMTAREVAQALGSSAVYLDLGHHPGKDRMPREAALAGAIVVVAERGSGAFAQDVPIDARFKVRLGKDFEGRVVDQVEAALATPARAIASQRPYVEAIKREPSVFRDEVGAVFARYSASGSGGVAREIDRAWNTFE